VFDIGGKVTAEITNIDDDADNCKIFAQVSIVASKTKSMDIFADHFHAENEHELWNTLKLDNFVVDALNSLVRNLTGSTTYSGHLSKANSTIIYPYTFLKPKKNPHPTCWVKEKRNSGVPPAKKPLSTSIKTLHDSIKKNPMYRGGPILVRNIF
jgi:hypothetical protein